MLRYSMLRAKGNNIYYTVQYSPGLFRGQSSECILKRHISYNVPYLHELAFIFSFTYKKGNICVCVCARAPVCDTYVYVHSTPTHQPQPAIITILTCLHYTCVFSRVSNLHACHYPEGRNLWGFVERDMSTFPMSTFNTRN